MIIPEKIRDIMNMLLANGNQAYLIGGCVRDNLLGLTPKDYDIVTDATPAVITTLFRDGADVKFVGAHFGVVIVDGVEIATFRSDGEYHDGRRPASVTFVKTLKEDVRRRDFTINGIAEDIHGTITDFQDGLKDIKSKTLGCIGNAEARLREDRLRILRAVNFKTRFGFQYDVELETALKYLAPLISDVAPERIQTELQKMIVPGRAYDSISDLYTLKILEQLIYPIVLTHEIYQKSFEILRKIQLSDVASNLDHISLLTAFMYATDNVNLPERFLGKYMYSNAAKEKSKSIIQILDKLPRFLKDYRYADMIKMCSIPEFKDALTIFQAIDSQTYVGIQLFMKDLPIKFIPDPIFNGNDLASLGYPAGPIYKQILEALQVEQIEGRVQNKQEAKKFVTTFMDGC